MRFADPAEATRLAHDHRDDDDPDIAALALITLSQVAVSTARFDQAASLLDQATAIATRSRAARFSVELSGAAVLVRLGRADEGQELLESIVAPTPRAQAKLLMNKAWAAEQTGHLNRSIGYYSECEQLATTLNDPQVMLRLLLNRSSVYAQGGRLADAFADADAAARLAAEQSVPLLEAQAHSNAAVALGRMRQFRESFERFDLAANTVAEANGTPDPSQFIDRAEVLMYAGLLSDAVSVAREAVRLAGGITMPALMADAYRVQAAIELADGAPRSAVRTAQFGKRVLRRAHIGHAVPRLDSIEQQAQMSLLVAFDDGLHREIDATVAALLDAGWGEAASELRAARLAFLQRVGHLSAAADDIAALSNAANAADGPVTRLRSMYAEALQALVDGRTESAIDVCRQGLLLVDRTAGAAIDIEERIAARVVGNELSQLIIDVAIDEGNAVWVFGASEGTRARALDDEIDNDVAADVRLSKDAAAEILEHAQRLAHGCRVVSWIESRHRVWALVVDPDRMELVDVADIDEFERRRDRVLAWLDRSAAEPSDVADRCRRAVEGLADVLLAPLERRGASTLVVVPSRRMHGVPWGALAIGAGWDHAVVAPSVRLWVAAELRDDASTNAVTMIAGPSVEYAEPEADQIGRCVADLRYRGGDDATALEVKHALSQPGSVNLAAHGQFKVGRPLLSTLELASGKVPLTDVIPGRVTAGLVTLSSCEGSAHAGTTGGEVLGLGALLLARGARAVLGPLTAVPDDLCGAFVAAVYQRLAQGATIGEAVAHTQRHWLSGRDLGRWGTAASFVVIGSSATRLLADRGCGPAPAEPLP